MLTSICNILLVATLEVSHCSSGPIVVIMAERSRPRPTMTSKELDSSNSVTTADRVGSTKSLNMGPPVSAMDVWQE